MGQRRAFTWGDGSLTQTILPPTAFPCDGRGCEEGENLVAPPSFCAVLPYDQQNLETCNSMASRGVYHRALWNATGNQSVGINPAARIALGVGEAVNPTLDESAAHLLTWRMSMLV